MPTDAQRRNLASAHYTEVQVLTDKVKYIEGLNSDLCRAHNQLLIEGARYEERIAELEKQLENSFSAINYWKEEAEKYKILYETVKKT